MDMHSAGLILCAVLAFAHPPGLGAQEVARVLGAAINRSDLPAPAAGPAAELGKLYDLVWNAVSRHYIELNGLDATPEEVAAALSYEREFKRKDRAQRVRKLKELDQRLADGWLEPAQRAWLEEFRATLARLAQSDLEDDRVPAPDPQREAAHLVRGIELWKMNGALYEQFGGIVALTRFGPFPHGARVALLEDYERRGLLRFSDRRLRERLFSLLRSRPALTLAPGRVDFTPYWERPIPPSYFPD